MEFSEFSEINILYMMRERIYLNTEDFPGKVFIVGKICLVYGKLFDDLSKI
jgi:hypothetical protein